MSSCVNCSSSAANPATATVSSRRFSPICSILLGGNCPGWPGMCAREDVRCDRSRAERGWKKSRNAFENVASSKPSFQALRPPFGRPCLEMAALKGAASLQIWGVKPSVQGGASASLLAKRTPSGHEKPCFAMRPFSCSTMPVPGMRKSRSIATPSTSSAQTMPLRSTRR